ncbi:MAG TPA: hypothetical protein PLI57_04595 [Spirochaetota bacterium]|nr:hypothetical protein [Spirochaetota bacterium]
MYQFSFGERRDEYSSICVKFSSGSGAAYSSICVEFLSGSDAAYMCQILSGSGAAYSSICVKLFVGERRGEYV